MGHETGKWRKAAMSVRTSPKIVVPCAADSYLPDLKFPLKTVRMMSSVRA